MQKFSLQMAIPRIKNNINELATAFGTKIIEMAEIGNSSSGMQYVEKTRWPIGEALDFFESQGAIRRKATTIEIVDENYFNIDLKNLTVPIGFNIDERISVDLTIMMGLYGQLFDIENRLRFFLTGRLKQKYGNTFITKLTRKVQDSIAIEKSRNRVFMTDMRIAELEFSNFSDLIEIFKHEAGFISEKRDYQILLEKMQYLNEIRTAIGHHNRLLPDESVRINESCQAIRRLLEQNNGYVV